MRRTVAAAATAVEVDVTGPEGDVASTFCWRTTRAGHGHHVPPSSAREGR